MSNTASLKKDYQERIVPALTKEFGYKTVMQVPVLKKMMQVISLPAILLEPAAEQDCLKKMIPLQKLKI